MSLAWDFMAASAVVLVLAWAFLSVFSLSANSLSENVAWAEKQRALFFKADFLLKNCFPDGIAYCENGFLFSHKAHQRANLSFGSGGVCIKRLVLQKNNARVLVVCS